MDTIPPEHRSWNMSRIKGKNTGPEVLVRSLLHILGYRFRLHRKDLPGKPDIVLPKFRTVIFVNGCYWHRHVHCPLAYIPKTNVAFWLSKFEENEKRDRRNYELLLNLNWKVRVVWECALKGKHKLSLPQLSTELKKLMESSADFLQLSGSWTVPQKNSD